MHAGQNFSFAQRRPIDNVFTPKKPSSIQTNWQQTDPQSTLQTSPTEQSDAERSASRMTRILAVLPAGVVVLDGEGRVQECNPAALRLLGEPLSGERWVVVIKRAFAPRPDDGHDVSLADGRLVNISTSPLEGEAGQIVLLHEVTETRQLQTKVSHLQRLSAMGEMAARLAHQIRTPLSSAMLYLAPLQKEDTEANIRRRFAQRLQQSLGHMEQLVRNMLAFSRGDMASSAPVSIAELLEDVSRQFLAEPETQTFNLTVYNRTHDSYVIGSQPALISALNNLLNNARHASGQFGKIVLTAEYADEDVQQPFIDITVEDNGPGIDANDFDKIMQPFYTTRASGTGLGLAVVQSIAKAHKGLLWVDSHPGEGSTFSLRLPVYQSQPHNQAEQVMGAQI